MQVIQKTAEIIRLLAKYPNKKCWKATEVSKELAMNISTTHRILQSMKNNGFINQDSKNKQYSLGINFIYFAEIVREMNLPGLIAYPSLKKLYDNTEETVFMTVKEGDACTVVERINSVHELRIVKQIGDTRLLGEGPCGKTILAYLPDEIKERISGYTKNKEACERDLVNIQKNGYHKEFIEEYQSTVFSAPLFSREGNVVASISVIIPQCRMSEEVEEKTAGTILEISRDFIEKEESFS